MHSEETINEEIKKIIQIKKINSSEFNIKLKYILTKSNLISKYKNLLKKLYEEKIDKNNKQQMKMLYDIYFHYFPNIKNIQDIDTKWRKFIYFLFFSRYWISRQRSFD